MIILEMGASADSYTDYVWLFMNILTALVIAGSIFRCVAISINYMSGEETLDELLKKLRKVITAAILCGSVPQIIRIIAVAYGSI